MAFILLKEEKGERHGVHCGARHISTICDLCTDQYTLNLSF